MKISAGVADAFLSLSRRRVRLPAPQSPAVESPLEHLLTRRSVSRDRVQASAAPQAAQQSEDAILFPESSARLWPPRVLSSGAARRYSPCGGWRGREEDDAGSGDNRAICQ